MTKYLRMNDYEFIQLDMECIILNTDEFTLTKLNEVGGYCWSLLGVAQTVNSISEAVREEYASVGESVEEDVEAFLTEMIGRGLVQYAVS
ncbi:PqqD family protein [Paenibacillus sp. CGMCC 1.16610]|uniref:PqqD family peptide modification chaperone n=1 Tax=Paenibacillus anseongense TaxID=2682845 RepID=A0ABW9U148_9BACL|nr:MULTISPECIES: PqqD family protein [Paenibacillus]MBA2943324.1 PqqD family protein [Paenibacillus sp. CGMCC 1.16610]MVQ33822.1 PqqD family peptide modification chaperone [Paenibacillus anseongense]